MRLRQDTSFVWEVLNPVIDIAVEVVDRPPAHHVFLSGYLHVAHVHELNDPGLDRQLLPFEGVTP